MSNREIVVSHNIFNRPNNIFILVSCQCYAFNTFLINSGSVLVFYLESIISFRRAINRCGFISKRSFIALVVSRTCIHGLFKFRKLIDYLWRYIMPTTNKFFYCFNVLSPVHGFDVFRRIL